MSFNYPKNYQQRVALGITDDPKNIEYAEKLMARVQIAIRAGVYSNDMFFKGKENLGGKTTIEAFSKQWIESLTHEAATTLNYQSSMNTLNSWFGKVPLKDLLPSIIQKKFKASKLSPKTVRNYVGVLSAMYSAAISDKLVSTNPCAEVKLPKKKAPEETIDPLEPVEVERILSYFSGTEPQYQNLVQFMIETGVRPQEIVVLTYADLNFPERTARINKALAPKGTIKLPKNDLTRHIDLTDKALAALNSQRQYTQMKDDPSNLIFVNPFTKSMLNYNHFRERTWYRALKALGIRKRVLYSCRHTFGSTLVSMGLPMKYVSTQLGHGSTQVTERHYAKWMKSSNAAMLDIRNKQKPQTEVA